jgi:uncharacterized protein
MPELLACQRAFAAALKDSAAVAQAECRLSGDSALIERRFAIYRGNASASIAKALGATYPVVQRVVGIQFFEAMVEAHRRAHPSISGDLNDYGAEFPAYLEDFAHTRHLLYLPDLARLEWAVHRAEGAADAKAFDVALLAVLSPAQQATLRFCWAPGLALVDSRYPIARVWQIHQGNYLGEFSVDWTTPQCALVAREGWRVGVSTLGAGEAAFVDASLNQNAALAAATETALATDPKFDLGRLLSRAVSTGLITRIVIDEEGLT